MATCFGIFTRFSFRFAVDDADAIPYAPNILHTLCLLNQNMLKTTQTSRQLTALLLGTVTLDADCEYNTIASNASLFSLFHSARVYVSRVDFVKRSRAFTHTHTYAPIDFDRPLAEVRDQNLRGLV